MSYVEGRSATVEFRWAKGDYSRLPTFVTDLFSRPLSVMVAAGEPAAHAAKAAGLAVPLVFAVGQDPVRSGLREHESRRILPRASTSSLVIWEASGWSFPAQWYRWCAAWGCSSIRASGPSSRRMAD
jgi:hypothetical protein